MHGPVPMARPIYKGRPPAASTKGGGRPSAARPLLWIPCIWVSPWVRVRVFGLPGQVFQIFTTLMSRLSMGVALGTRPSSGNSHLVL